MITDPEQHLNIFYDEPEWLIDMSFWKISETIKDVAGQNNVPSLFLKDCKEAKVTP